MAAQLLPLFPLSVVLLPSTPLPLHIFEERYKEMMGEIIPVRGEFGVVLAKDDGIVNVGCTATVDRVLQRYPDGRLDLVAIGRRRFQLMSLDEEKSYLRAAVEFFNDEEAGEVPLDLRRKAIAGYQRLRDVEKPSVIDRTRARRSELSFQLAQFISDPERGKRFFRCGRKWKDWNIWLRCCRITLCSASGLCWREEWPHQRSPKNTLQASRARRGDAPASHFRCGPDALEKQHLFRSRIRSVLRLPGSFLDGAGRNSSGAGRDRNRKRENSWVRVAEFWSQFSGVF